MESKMASLLRCQYCRREFKKKEILFGDGDIINDHVCICGRCKIHRPKKSRPAYWPRIIGLALLFWLVVIVSVVGSKIWSDYLRKQELEKEVKANIRLLTVAYLSKVSELTNKVSHQPAIPYNEKVDDGLTNIEDFTNSLDKLRADLHEKFKDVEEAQRLRLQFTIDCLNEVKRLHPERHDEFNQKIEMLRNLIKPDKVKSKTLDKEGIEGLTKLYLKPKSGQ